MIEFNYVKVNLTRCGWSYLNERCGLMFQNLVSFHMYNDSYFIYFSIWNSQQILNIILLTLDIKEMFLHDLEEIHQLVKELKEIEIYEI